MSTVIAALGGVAVGAGVWFTIQTLRRPSLAELLPTLVEHASEEPKNTGTRAYVRATAFGVHTLAGIGWPGQRTRHDLAACGIDVNSHRAETSLAAIAGTVLCASLVTAALPTSSPLTVPVALLLGVVCLTICLAAPVLVLRGRAERHREQLRAATSIVADLVGVALAGGAGISGALTAATQRGNGSAFIRIRTSLHEAYLRTRPPWDALSDLAQHTGVRELDELASSIRLAGTAGARVRASVRAKATSLRAHRLAALETEALEATERMTLPVMLLVLGFFVLMGYPAIVHVTAGF